MYCRRRGTLGACGGIGGNVEIEQARAWFKESNVGVLPWPGG